MRSAVKGLAFLALLVAFVGLVFWAGYSWGATSAFRVDKEVNDKLRKIGMACAVLLVKPEGDKR